MEERRLTDILLLFSDGDMERVYFTEDSIINTIDDPDLNIDLSDRVYVDNVHIDTFLNFLEKKNQV